MSRVREQLDIRAPLLQVFAFFDDVANAAILVPRFVEVTAVDAVESGGRRVEYTTLNKNGGLVEASSEHLVYDPPHRTVSRGLQSGISTTSTREFVPIEGGTLVVAAIEWSVPVKYVAAMITSPLRGPLRRSLRQGLRAAKEALESGPASLTPE